MDQTDLEGRTYRPDVSVIGEVAHVESEAAVGGERNELADVVHVFGLPYAASPMTLYSPSLTWKPR